MKCYLQDSEGRVTYCSPADIFQQNRDRALSKSGPSVEAEEGEEGGEVGRKGVRWDPNLISYSQQQQEGQVETTSASRPVSEVMAKLQLLHTQLLDLFLLNRLSLV